MNKDREKLKEYLKEDKIQMMSIQRPDVMESLKK